MKNKLLIILMLALALVSVSYAAPTNCSDSMQDGCSIMNSITFGNDSGTVYNFPNGINFSFGTAIAGNVILDCNGTILNGTRAASTYGIRDNYGYENLTIKNCTVQNYFIGINVNTNQKVARNLTITDVEVGYCNSTNILIAGVNTSTLNRVYSHDSVGSHGLYFDASAAGRGFYPNVKNSRFVNNANNSGIQMNSNAAWSVWYPVIVNNNFSGNKYGVNDLASRWGNVTGNRIVSSTRGYVLHHDVNSDGQGWNWRANGTLLESNTFSSNTESDVYVGNGTVNNTLRNNVYSSGVAKLNLIDLSPAYLALNDYTLTFRNPSGGNLGLYLVGQGTYVYLWYEDAKSIDFRNSTLNVTGLPASQYVFERNSNTILAFDPSFYKFTVSGNELYYIDSDFATSHPCTTGEVALLGLVSIVFIIGIAMLGYNLFSGNFSLGGFVMVLFAVVLFIAMRASLFVGCSA